MKLLVKTITSFVNAETLIELSQADFDANIITYDCYINETPIIKITDTGSLYSINNLQDMLPYFNSSEILLTINNSDLIPLTGGGSGPSEEKLVATLSQNLTEDPIVVEIVNNFTTNSLLTITRTGVGVYNVEVKNVGGPSHVNIFLGEILFNDGENIPSAKLEYVSSFVTGGFYFNTYTIKTFQSGTPTDNVLLNTPLTIYS